jgi:hypothetical protein
LFPPERYCSEALLFDDSPGPAAEPQLWRAPNHCAFAIDSIAAPHYPPSRSGGWLSRLSPERSKRTETTFGLYCPPFSASLAGP